MDEQKKSSKFGLGLLLGTIIGGIAAFFLAPNSGEENRKSVMKLLEGLRKELDKMELDKKVKEIYGEVTEESRTTFLKVKKELIKELEDLKDRWREIDKEKYKIMVSNLVDNLKKNSKTEAKILNKMKASFLEDWEKFSKP